MKAATFLDNFERLAETPNGIPKLRELILQFAVQGKLVAQDPSDESASVLMDQIKERKAQLVKAGKIKKSKQLPTIADNEAPFDLPRRWELVRLGEIAEKLGAGSTPLGGKRVYQDEGIKFLRSQNVWNDGLRLEGVALIPEEIHERMNGTVVRPGDVLLNITGASIGRSAVVPDDFDEGNVSQHVAIVRLIDLRLRGFIHICMISPLVQNTIMRVQVGISREGLSMSRLREFVFPCPPLAEQKRIVAKVDELMQLCDELEARQAKRNEVRVQLSTASLDQLTTAREPKTFVGHWQRICDNFDLLYDAPETVNQLRQAILQLAVQGKLIPQDPNDEPAEELPLENLLRENSLNGYSKRPSSSPPGVDILRISAGTARNDFLVDETDHKWVEASKKELEKFSLQPGDLLGCRFNGNLRFVGRFSLYTGGTGRQQIYPDKLIRFRLDESKADPAYVRYAMNAAQTRERIESFCATTAGNIGISATNLKTVALPVPSLGQQARIVAKVDELMKLCDELEDALKRRHTDGEKLMEAVVASLSQGVNGRN